MMILTKHIDCSNLSTSERQPNGFYLNRPHLKKVLEAKRALKEKGYSEEWMDAQMKFLPKLMVRTVKPI